MQAGWQVPAILATELLGPHLRLAAGCAEGWIALICAMVFPGARTSLVVSFDWYGNGGSLGETLHR